jgi:hypothetical protein
MRILDLLLTFSLASGIARGQACEPKRSEVPDVSLTVCAFLEDAFVRHRAELASANFCSDVRANRCLPESPDDATPRDAVARFLKAVGTFSRRSERLEDVIRNPRALSEDDGNIVPIRHANEELFQLFRLNPGRNPRDLWYVCKYDDSESFREAVAASDVVYSIIQVQSMEAGRDVNLELLWKPSGNKWCLLTAAVLDE